MVTEQEKEQLIREYQTGPASVAGLLLTFVACLLLLIVLAFVGLDIHAFGGNATPAQTAAHSR